jgi:hypothetical protein
VAFLSGLPSFVGEFGPGASFPFFENELSRKSLDTRVVLVVERQVEMTHHDIQCVVPAEEQRAVVLGSGAADEDDLFVRMQMLGVFHIENAGLPALRKRGCGEFK